MARMTRGYGLLSTWLGRRKWSVVLIDGDNISPAAIPSILDEVCLERQLREARAILSRIGRSWQDAAAESGIELVVLPDVVPGKNSVDLALAVEATALAFDAHVDEIVIVSSDADFTYLAQRLRKLGKHVRGIGADHTSPSFRTSCSRFTALSTIWNGASRRVPKGERYRRLRALRKKIIRCLPAYADENGWARVARLESFLRRRDATFDPRALGFRNFGRLLESMSEVELDTNRQRVRQRQPKTPPSLQP